MITIMHHQLWWRWWWCGELVKLIMVKIYESIKTGFKSWFPWYKSRLVWIKNDSLTSDSVRVDLRSSNCLALTHEDDHASLTSNRWPPESGNDKRSLYKSSAFGSGLFSMEVGGTLWRFVSGSRFGLGDILLRKEANSGEELGFGWGLIGSCEEGKEEFLHWCYRVECRLWCGIIVFRVIRNSHCINL
jgi:hypothetical protein